MDPRAHPLAEIFPMLPEAEIAELADDIVTYGQRVPIVLLDGMVLDGRNRLAACRFADVEPVFEDYDGDDPLGFVLSHNLHRRHLTESQRAMVAAKLATMRHGGDRKSGAFDQTANLRLDQAADMLDVSERSVESARRVIRDGAEELQAAVERRELTVSTASALAALPKREQIEVLASADPAAIKTIAKQVRAAQQKTRHTVRLAHMEMVAEKGRASAPGKVAKLYPVVYADPPWRFDVRSEETGREKSAENHYPTMPTEEIAGLLAELGGVAARDAVLFLWATNPMLLDDLRTMQAWGFTYVHHWIWDKEVAGTGYWGRDRHELLLIGRRGDAVAPLPGTQPETVHRERKGRHSAKPDWFAEQIERLYPGISKIELFARAPRAGWDAWGYEAGDAKSSSAPPAGERIRSAQDGAEESLPVTGQPPAGSDSTRSSVSRKDFLDWKALSAIDGGVAISGPALDGMRACLYVEPERMALTPRGRALLDILDERVRAATGEDGGVRVADETEPQEQPS